MFNQGIKNMDPMAMIFKIWTLLKLTLCGQLAMLLAVIGDAIVKK
jgi:hypothetical protein